MRKHTVLSGLGGVRPGILILSLLIAATAILQAIPCSAANPDDITSSVLRSLAPETVSKPDEAVRARMSETYGKLPLFFEANGGQTDLQVQFLSRGSRHILFLTPTEAVLALSTPKQRAEDEFQRIGGKAGRPKEATRTVLRMTFAGANPTPRVTGQAELP
ncbi:MAG: hypothetical protein DMD98_19925, partial [Candidatus Rokuibacteriota bacterium]